MSFSNPFTLCSAADNVSQLEIAEQSSKSSSVRYIHFAQIHLEKIWSHLYAPRLIIMTCIIIISSINIFLLRITCKRVISDKKNQKRNIKNFFFIKCTEMLPIMSPPIYVVKAWIIFSLTRKRQQNYVSTDWCWEYHQPKDEFLEKNGNKSEIYA